MEYPQAFLDAVNELLEDEGEHSENPSDPGGDTWYGISRRAYPDIPWPPTLDDAIAIYFRDYWTKYGYADLQPLIGQKLFNIAPDIGEASAVVALQRALRAVQKPLLEDGVLGPLTKTAANAIDPSVLIVTLRSELAAHYRLVAQANSQDEAFIKGWLIRAYR